MKINNFEKSLHEKFSKYGQNAKFWMRKCVFLLPKINKYRIWEKRGFGSIYEYAAKLAGMSRHTVDDGLRILEKIKDKPKLKKLAKERGVNAVRPVAAIAIRETDGFWAGKVKRMSKNTLEMYVREYRCHFDRALPADRQAERVEKSYRDPVIPVNNSVIPAKAGIYPGNNEKTPDNFCSSKNENSQNTSNFNSRTSTGGGFTKLENEILLDNKTTLTLELDKATAAKLEKLKGAGNWDDLVNELLELREKELEKEKPEPVQAKSRHIPSKIKKFILKKYNNTCAFPTCTKPYEFLHHTDRFALIKEHNPDTIIPLCKAHERIAHQGLIENEEKKPESWRIRTVPDLLDPRELIDQAVQKYQTGQLCFDG